MRAIISLCIGIGAFLYGAAGAMAQELFACVSTKNGSIRMVASRTDCIAGRETAVSWNVVGPQGPPGGQGPPGPGGSQGPPGPAGSPLRVFDGDGNVLGIPGDDGRVFNEELRLTVFTATLRGTNEAAVDIWFPTEDCSGQGFLSLAVAPRYAESLLGPYPAPFPTYFVAPKDAGIEDGIDILTRLGPNGCVQNCGTGGGCPQDHLLPADPFTGVLPFVIPVPDPVYVGLAE